MRRVGLAIAACLVGTLIGLGQPSGPAKAAPASSWQMPCFAGGSPNYQFGRYVSGWGYHTGEDICHDANIPVYAPANGVVVYSGRTPDSYRWGNLILIEHTDNAGNRTVSLFGHLGDNRQAFAGQTVVKGQRIGYTGPDYTAANGNWGAHLHFGIHPGGYGAPVGAYAAWIHGYSSSTSYDGWVPPSAHVQARLTAYDYLAESIDGQGAMYNQGTSQVVFKIRNTGAYPWYADGSGTANPMRLGTDGPRDRASPFAGGTGWVGNTRLKMQADTPSGGLATFTATFASNRVAGHYTECFTPVAEGATWLPAYGMCLGIDVLPPSYRAAFHNQLITTNSDPNNLGGTTDQGNYLMPGQKLNVKLILKNVGELTWDPNGPNPPRLGTSNPLDRPSAFATGGDGSIPSNENWPAYNRSSNLDGKYNPTTNLVTPAGPVATGEYGVFSFTVTAPQAGGSYNEYFRPIAEGHSWMPDLGIYLPFRVLPTGDHHQYVTQSGPITVGSGTTTASASLQVRNTGRNAWPIGGNLRLGTDRPMDNQYGFSTLSGANPWVSATRPSSVDANVTSPGKQTIDPGEVARFDFTLTIPPNAPVGSYPLYVRPVREGVSWLEDYGIYFPVTVTAAPYSYQFQKQVIPQTSTTQGGTTLVKIALKNTGRTAWPAAGAGAVRLGTERPKDRTSSFYESATGDPWLNTSRASAIDGQVVDLATLATVPATQISPGETALFSFTMKANAAPGTYNEYFNLVAEGVQWMTDIGLFIPQTITSASLTGTQTQSAPTPTATVTPSFLPSASPTL